jgi:hypothetical protein
MNKDVEKLVMIALVLLAFAVYTKKPPSIQAGIEMTLI